MQTMTSTAMNRHVGEVLARASRGERFLITSHGRPFALIGPVPEDCPPLEDLPAAHVGPPPKKRAA